MERETINKLFLELSQFTTATTAKEIEAEKWIIEACILLRKLESFSEEAAKMISKKPNWIR